MLLSPMLKTNPIFDYFTDRESLKILSEMKLIETEAITTLSTRTIPL